MKLLFEYLLILVYFIKIAFCDYEFTDKMASMCKRYVCQNGYNYQDYFEVTGGHRAPGIKFEMHLAIKAKNNGHIMLSTVPNPRMSSPVYEITVGAGANTFTELRRMRMRMGKSTTDTKNILDEEKFVPFWIRAHDNGLIEFGQEGKDLPIVSFRDILPLDINYFSFASWTGIDAIVLYDCPVAGNMTDESKLVEKPLTTTEILRKDLLSSYSSSTGNLTEVPLKMSIALLSISYDVAKSIFTTRATLRVKWTDKSFMWDLLDYDNVSSVQFGLYEIRKPDIRVFTALDMDSFQWVKIPIFVTHKGVIECKARIISRTWCSPGKALVQWPHDEHVCNLKIGLWRQYQWNYAYKIGLLGNFREMEEEFFPTEWELTKVDLTSEWSKYSPDYLSYENHSTHNTLSIDMYIRRIDDNYKIMFYSPFICTVVMIIVTFLIQTSTTVKVTILSVEQFFVLLFMFQIMDRIPAYGDYIPHIVLFYYWAILSLWMSIVVNLLVFKMYHDTQPWMLNMRKFLLNLRLQNCLLLTNLRVDDTYNNLKANEDSNKCEEDQESQWQMAGVILDRIVFTIFTVIFSIVCCFN